MSPVMMAPPSVAPAAGAGVVQMGYVQSPYALPGQPVRPYAPLPNGYLAVPQPGTTPPGMLRYPSLYRPVYPPRPPVGVGVIPPLMRPPVPVVRGPVVPPAIRPVPSPIIAQTDKPQTTVYVGKISSAVENDFMLSLLQLCGPVKSWKRAQDPTNGLLKGFGFCEFESAEGVLRALRLLSKLKLDGQELMLNVNQATRGYLEHYVQKKMESSTKPKADDAGGADNMEENASDAKTNEAAKSGFEDVEPASQDPKQDKEKENKENPDTNTFGLVTDEDKQADQEALEKLTDMISERIKNKPLPPPPPPPQVLSTDASGNSNVENHPKSRDGESDAGGVKSEGKNEDDLTSESKPSSEHDKDETSSPDRRRHDRGRDRDQDTSKREKERELERYERMREQERAKREKEREYKIWDDERKFKTREKQWESREREKEHWRKREREREQDRAYERKLEVMEQEHDGEDGYKRRRHRSSDEDRERRQREKEDDLADRLREEEEIAEAKRRDEEQQLKKEQEEALRILTGHVVNGHETAVSPVKSNHEDMSDVVASDPNVTNGETFAHNVTGDESGTPASDMVQQSGTAPAKKLGFGLQGSGKRASVPSVFNEDEDEDARKDKKMRPLVPIDYSTEEQAQHPSISDVPSLNSAAEVAKRISNVKEGKPDAEKDRSRRSHEKHSHRGEHERHDEESRRENADHRSDKVRNPDNQKLLDAKELIDMIPKTKNELFSYEINWAIYDKNALHIKMRPWINRKITEFLAEEEPELVDYIVSSLQEHVKATEMLERLQILDEEAEMFVLKMWRMLIYEIKRVETGLASRSKS